VRCSHSIHLLGSGNYLPAVYRMLGAHLESGRAVIYAAEADLPTKTSTRIKQSGIIKDVKSYIESGALTIADIRSVYSPKATNLDGKAMLGRWLDLVEQVQRKNKFGRVVIISSGTMAFSDSSSLESLLAYEDSIRRTVAASMRKRLLLQIICCYPAASIARMTPKYLFSIINSHQCTMGSDWSYKEWRPGDAIALIGRGLDRALGAGSATLIFQTLKLIYKIDSNQIISRPQLLEDMLRKVIGEKAADMALKSISDETKKMIQSGGTTTAAVTG
jgi:MEDS: MEthanogen/methylotroph, DcmR Sensory domain